MIGNASKPMLAAACSRWWRMNTNGRLNDSKSMRPVLPDVRCTPSPIPQNIVNIQLPAR